MGRFSIPFLTYFRILTVFNTLLLISSSIGGRIKQLPTSCSICPQDWQSLDWSQYCYRTFHLDYNPTWNDSFNNCSQWNSELMWIGSENEALWFANETRNLKINHSDLAGIHINLQKDTYCPNNWCWPNQEYHDPKGGGKYIPIIPWKAGQPSSYTKSYICSHIWFQSQTDEGGVDDIRCDTQEQFHYMVICKMRKQQLQQCTSSTINNVNEITSKPTTKGNVISTTQYLTRKIIPLTDEFTENYPTMNTMNTVIQNPSTNIYEPIQSENITTANSINKNGTEVTNIQNVENVGFGKIYMYIILVLVVLFILFSFGFLMIRMILKKKKESGQPETNSNNKERILPANSNSKNNSQQSNLV